MSVTISDSTPEPAADVPAEQPKQKQTVATLAARVDALEKAAGIRPAEDAE